MTLVKQLKSGTLKAEPIQRALRSMARRALRSGRVSPGVTVVTVNWNSESYLRACVEGVHRYSPPGTPVIVVDNASKDGSRQVAASPAVRWLQMPVNLGHWLALDIGFLLARTEYVVALDVDAFPVANDWLTRLLSPLEEGYHLSGTHVQGGVVHPCCLAIRLQRFLERRHTFAPFPLAPAATRRDTPPHDRFGDDVGGTISLREERRFLFERTEIAGPGAVGSLWGGLVYHNFYATRFGSRIPLALEEVNTGINPDAVHEVWEQAVSRYLRTPADGPSA